MDGVHDLGGRQGFGPIDVTTDDPAFPEDWEGRVYAMVQSVGDDGMTIDWFRNIVELLPPAAYLTEPYFQKWHLVQLIELLQAGMLSEEEILTGQAAHRGEPPGAMSTEAVLERIKGKGRSFAVPTASDPAFAVGQAIRTKRHMDATHTRLPGYARGCEGQVIAHHGAHVLPDRSARGEEVGEHLYTVAFAARELWGDTANPRDDVTLDLWESYLVPA